MLLFFLLVSYNLPSHDIQVAYFKVYEEDKIVFVDFIFEKEDILNILSHGQTKLSSQELQSYVQENFSLVINNKKRNLTLGAMDVKEKHIHIQGNLKQTIQSISSLKINNSCLLGIENHSNIMQIRFHELERDFLMNTDRTTINVKY